MAGGGWQMKPAPQGVKAFALINQASFLKQQEPGKQPPLACRRCALLFQFECFFPDQRLTKASRDSWLG